MRVRYRPCAEANTMLLTTMTASSTYIVDHEMEPRVARGTHAIVHPAAKPITSMSWRTRRNDRGGRASSGVAPDAVNAVAACSCSVSTAITAPSSYSARLPEQAPRWVIHRRHATATVQVFATVCGQILARRAEHLRKRDESSRRVHDAFRFAHRASPRRAAEGWCEPGAVWSAVRRCQPAGGTIDFSST